MTPHLRWHYPVGIYYGQPEGMPQRRVAHCVRECHRLGLVFRAGAKTKALRVFNTGIECKEAEKDWHPMQQPLKAVKHYVEMFTEPHDLVIDTHGGGFTTAVACLLTKRKYVGCDVDAKAIENGELRLREAAHENGSEAVIPPEGTSFGPLDDDELEVDDEGNVVPPEGTSFGPLDDETA